MTKPLALLSLLLVLLSGVASAEVFEIPLAGLVGSYSVDVSNRIPGVEQRRIAAFDLGVGVTRVNSAGIRWSGEGDAGVGISFYEEFRWVGGLAAYVGNAGFPRWQAGVPLDAPDYHAEFSGKQPFEAMGNPNWEFLADGRGEVIVEVLAAAYFTGEMVVPVTARVDAVTLILDVETDSNALPVTRSTWGAIKALYQ